MPGSMDPPGRSDEVREDGEEAPPVPMACGDAAGSSSPRSPRRLSQLNPVAQPFDWPATGTPDWLRYSASPSSSSSSSEERDASPWPPVVSSRRKGKEVAVDPVPAPSRHGAPCGFMADARRAGNPFAGVGRIPSPPPRPDNRLPTAMHSAPQGDPEAGWEEVRRRRRGRREDRPARPASRPVPADLVGRCFNCLEKGHVAADCKNPSRCLRCKREGHSSRFCRRGRPPTAHPGLCKAGVPARRGVVSRPHSASSDATCSGGSRSTGRLGTPPAVCAPPSSGSEGTRHHGDDVHMTSPPPSPSSFPAGHPSRRPLREFCVIPRTQEIDDAEALLSSRALVAMVAGTRRTVSSDKVGRLLEEFYVLLPDDYTVYRHAPEDFLVIFTDPAVAQHVLHSQLPPEAAFQLVWKRWRRQATARFEPLRFRVLVELKGIPAHARNVSTAQIILGPACANLVEAPVSLVGNDRRALYVAAWCYHPDLIPNEKWIFIPDPPKPFEPGNLFLRPHEIIHSKLDGLWYNVLVRVVESQDWHESSDSSDDGTPPDRFNSSDDEEYPGASHGRRKGPWPKRTRFDSGDGAGSSSGPSLGPGWGPPFAGARGWSLQAPLTFQGRDYKKQQDNNLNSNSVRPLAEIAKGSGLVDSEILLVSGKEQVVRNNFQGDPMLVEACGTAAVKCKLTGQELELRLIKPVPPVPGGDQRDPMLLEAEISVSPLNSATEACGNMYDTANDLGQVGVTPVLSVIREAEPPLVDAGSTGLHGTDYSLDTVATQVEAVHFPEVVVSRRSAANAPKTARASTSPAINSGDPKKRKARQEIKAQGVKPGVASTKCAHEAPGSYLVFWPPGCGGLPTFSASLLLYGYPVSVRGT